MATEDDLRRIALSLPDTTERPSYGAPGFRVHDKLFLRIRKEKEGGVMCCVADLGEKEMLLATEPEKFFTIPHYDGYASVLLNLEALDEQELTEMIVDAWRARAPAKVLAAYEDQLPGGA